MPSGIRRRFLWGYLVVHLVVVALFVWALSVVVRRQMVADAQNRLLVVARILVHEIEASPRGLDDPLWPQRIAELGRRTGYRITLIKPDGEVVCDSMTGTQDIGDHSARPEVVQARRAAFGFSERFSDTVREPLFYIALRVPDPAAFREGAEATELRGVVRVAAPAGNVHAAVRSLQYYVWGFSLAMAAVTIAWLAFIGSRQLAPLDQFVDVARRIGKRELNVGIPSPRGNRDWIELADAFRQMQTEIHNRETHMRTHASRLEAVLASMIEGVLAIDADDRVALANQAACDMLRVAREELIGRPLLGQVRVKELAEAIETARKSGSFTEAEFQTRSPHRRVIRARISLLRTDSDSRAERPGIAIVMHDMTDLRKLETMRRDFVANVSHELKTPLSSIMAYAETLRDGAIHDPDRNVQFLEQIENQARYLNQQIQDLLQLARVESGQEVWDVTDVDANEIARRAVNQFTKEAEAKSIQLSFHASPQPAHVRADAEGVLTILHNLIVNAIRYTPSGGTVDVSVGVEGDQVVLEVRDTGLGIAPEHQERIFERFYRVDKARSRDLGGTGLGLSIVKHLVSAFGGQIELNSHVGHGSTFRIRLPSH